VPDRALSRALAEWLAETSLPADPWRSASAVRCTTADAGDAALRFVHNWSWEPADLALPARARDLLSDDEVEVLQLGPWDVRVLVERAPANSPRARAS
jgi:beta-galactosidase